MDQLERIDSEYQLAWFNGTHPEEITHLIDRACYSPTEGVIKWENKFGKYRRNEPGIKAVPKEPSSSSVQTAIIVVLAHGCEAAMVRLCKSLNKYRERCKIFALLNNTNIALPNWITPLKPPAHLNGIVLPTKWCIQHLPSNCDWILRLMWDAELVDDLTFPRMEMEVYGNLVWNPDPLVPSSLREVGVLGHAEQAYIDGTAMLASRGFWEKVYMGLPPSITDIRNDSVSCQMAEQLGWKLTHRVLARDSRAAFASNTMRKSERGVVCTTSLIDQNPRKYEEWIEYYTNLFECEDIDLVLVNNGSVSKSINLHSAKLVQLPNYLERRSIRIFPGWKRSFQHELIYVREKYKYIAHIEGDCWLRKRALPKFMSYFKSSGYFTAFSPTYRFPEAALQIINDENVLNYFINRYQEYSNLYENANFESDIIVSLKPNYILNGDRFEGVADRIHGDDDYVAQASLNDYLRLISNE